MADQRILAKCRSRVPNAEVTDIGCHSLSALRSFRGGPSCNDDSCGFRRSYALLLQIVGCGEIVQFRSQRLLGLPSRSNWPNLIQTSTTSSQAIASHFTREYFLKNCAPTLTDHEGKQTFQSRTQLFLPDLASPLTVVETVLETRFV